MALRFCTGFDGPDPLHGFNYFGVVGVVAGRNGDCVQFNGAPTYLRYEVEPTTTNHLILGFAVRAGVGDINGGGSTLNGGDPGLVNFIGYDPATTDWGSTSQFQLRVNPNGQLEVRMPRVDGSIIATSPVGVMIPDGVSWHYLEVDALIHPSTGHVIVHVDGFEVINYTGDTQGNTGTDQIVSIMFGGPTGGGYNHIDDLYVCDTTGTANNSFLGDIRVDVLHPTGNGTRSEFTGSDGDQVDNYALVDDLVLDTADFVTSAVVGDGDLYAFADLAGTRGVLAVQVQAYANKDVTGARAIEMLASDGTTTLVGDQKVLATTWDTFHQPFDTAPDGAAWTVAKVNAAQFGVEINA